MEEKKSLTRRDLVLCAIFLGLYGMFIVILPKTDALPRMVSLWEQVVAYMALGILGLVLFKDVFAGGIQHWKEHPVHCLFWIVGGFVAEQILSIVLSLPLGLLAPDYTSINDNGTAFAAKALTPVVAVLALGILGPLTEEVVYRVILTHKASQKIPAAVAIAGSSLLFMLIHIHALTLNEFLYCLPLLAPGLVFAFILHKTKDPTIPLILHLLTNVPAVLVLLTQ